jgi:ADP-heptose:LPS heptosyltransferase
VNVQTMRRVDRWIGAPLCLALTVIRRLDDLLLRRRPPARPGRVAVLKLAEQGATVLAYQALKNASRLVGEHNVFFVVFEENRFILDLLDVVPKDNVIVLRTGSLIQTAWDAIGAVLRMRREGVDATVDFEFFARSTAILSYLSGARTRVGYHAWFGEASWRGDLLTHRLSMNPFLHASEMFQTLIAALEMPADAFPACDVTAPESDDPPCVRFERGEVDEVANIIRERLGVAELPRLVLLNANCGDMLPLRRWPEDRYVALAHRLLEAYPDVAILLTGAPSERAAAAVLEDQIGSDRSVNLAGMTTLRQLLIVYGLSELLVTNDSGPGHYAALTPVDVISLFGPETPAVFGPRTERSHVLWAGLVCSPCVNAFNDRQSACPRARCMERISVDEVFHTASRVLDQRASRRDNRSSAPQLQ